MTDPLNPLQELERGFLAGEINKPEYIRRMYELHGRLFAYPQFIAGKNVQRIVLTPEHVLVTTREGVTMICNPGDCRITPIEILNFGDYELAETRLLQSFLKPDSILLDIGANTGWYSISLGRCVPQGKVLAFEPIPQTLTYLRKNLELNGITNVEIFEHGVSDENKEVTFYFHPSVSGATSARDLLENEEKVEVSALVRRLDDVLGSEPRIDLIKLDIEGAELYALRGGRELIRRTRPILFVEMLRKWTNKYGYSPNDIVSFMADLDYRCFAVEDGSLRTFSRMEESTMATNFFFIHRDVKNLPDGSQLD